MPNRTIGELQMPLINQYNRLITSLSAANDAERRIQDWIASHAGKHKDTARKAITTQSGEPSYWDDDLVITSRTMQGEPFSRRCSIYHVQYKHHLPIPLYTVYALVIFPDNETGPGALSVTIHEPPARNYDTLPWADQWPNSTDPITKILDTATHQDNLQRRRNRRSNQPQQFTQLSSARQAYGPVILVTPKTTSDATFSAILQQYRDSAIIATITETDQVSMSAEIPDSQLRQWLDAKAILVKESYDPVPPDHPITILNDPESLSAILTTLLQYNNETADNMAHQALLATFMIMMSEIQVMKTITEAATTDLSIQALGENLETIFERSIASPSDTPDSDPTMTTQELQRISTLEDLLEQQKEQNANLTDQVNTLQAQVTGYEQYLESEHSQSDPLQNDQNNQDNPASREDIVMEAITQPGRFPHLRFLDAAVRNLQAYGKTRPRGDEIITALDAVNTVAERYNTSEKGDIGSWKHYFNLPGWTYSNAESEPTMGKYNKSRQFQDHEKNRFVIVERHLTYRASGLQLFFDSDIQGAPFIIAYIGEHLPYATDPS